MNYDLVQKGLTRISFDLMQYVGAEQGWCLSDRRWRCGNSNKLLNSAGIKADGAVRGPVGLGKYTFKYPGHERQGRRSCARTGWPGKLRAPHSECKTQDYANERVVELNSKLAALYIIEAIMKSRQGGCPIGNRDSVFSLQHCAGATASEDRMDQGTTGAMGNRIRSGRQFRRLALHWGPRGPTWLKAPLRGNLKNCKCTAAGGSGELAAWGGWMCTSLQNFAYQEILLDKALQQVRAMVEQSNVGRNRIPGASESHSVPGNMDCEVTPPFLAEARRESRKKVFVRVQSCSAIGYRVGVSAFRLVPTPLLAHAEPAKLPLSCVTRSLALFGQSNGSGIVRLQRLRRDCRLELGITFGALSTSAPSVRIVKLRTLRPRRPEHLKAPTIGFQPLKTQLASTRVRGRETG
ncbi:hypothetical protein C8J57DRAFT_1559346 [Mycena rebaudengoi]|nr:hypothetical protein C8J57DRAFT_1559346 [Mycena rebaudengoi]